MASVRPATKINLTSDKIFSLDVVITNNYTHSVQITHQPTQKTLHLPLDPTDRTLAAVIDEEFVKAIGQDAETLFTLLSTELPKKIGAKEFVLIPANSTLPGYTPTGDDEKTARSRQSSREMILEKTSQVLNEYKSLTDELNTKYEFVTDEKSLLTTKDALTRYQEISTVLSQADFTPGKMTEYKNEDLQGKLSRVKNAFITPIFMLDKSNKNIVGMIRAVHMNNQIVYLSDETIHQELITLDHFSGNFATELQTKRQAFLLAYLFNKACTLLADKKHFLIIAAAGRVEQYEKCGFAKFPLQLQTWKAVSHFGPVGPVLTEVQEAIKKLSLPTPSPASAGGAFAKNAAVSEKDTKKADAMPAISTSGPGL